MKTLLLLLVASTCLGADPRPVNPAAEKQRQQKEYRDWQREQARIAAERQALLDYLAAIERNTRRR